MLTTRVKGNLADLGQRIGELPFSFFLERSTNKVIVQFDALDNEGCNIYLFHKPISNIIL